MSEEVIDRVDDLIRKNNIKYKDEQSQKAYQIALKEYEKHAKMNLTKHYGQLVKQGNKKAVEKTKAKKKVLKKTKKSVVKLQPEKEVHPLIQIEKKRKSGAEIAIINKTIEARAERIIEEQQLQKLSKKLQQQKKRTKLFELNEKCKKMLSKSHQRIVSVKNIPYERLNILKNLEQKAKGQINELDEIINNLIDKANGKEMANNYKSQNIKQTSKDIKTSNDQKDNELEPDFGSDNLQNYGEYENQEQSNNENGNSSISDQAEIQDFNNILDLNTIIFEKSTDQLLEMDYIPI